MHLNLNIKNTGLLAEHISHPVLIAKTKFQNHPDLIKKKEV